MDLLDELRLQRELIRKHLAWLDEKIAKQESDEPKNATSEVDAAAPKPESPAEAKSEAVTLPKKPDSEQKEAPEEAFASYKAPAGDEVLRAKIGCLILFTLGTLLFLFLLFGLPYLID
ncbi:MAG: hypothetical protein R6U56_01335 [Opitutales bacterium]